MRRTNIQALDRIFKIDPRPNVVSLDDLLETFSRQNRSLLRDSEVEDDGRIRIDTSGGAM